MMPGWLERLIGRFRRPVRPGDAAWTRWFGGRGEREAARHLRRKGMRIITQGYRTARGEIDLIARDGPLLVFVEVKTRRRGEPARAVTPAKQKRVVLAAYEFLHRHRIPATQGCRYDVVAIVWPDGEGPPEIEHFADAFRPGPRFG
ncbi:MAG: YraN family protein [Isosphaeraceae bacterium]